MSDHGGIRVTDLRAATGVELVGLEREPLSTPEVLHAAVESAWQQAAGRLPALYDGPTVLSDGLREPVSPGSAARIGARRGSYRQLIACDAGVAIDATLLGVTGLITAPLTDGSGLAVLMGRRSAGTRLYGGRWEIAPAGGVEITAPAGGDPVLQTLRVEALEETGLDLEGMPAQPIAIVHDAHANSDDVVMRVDLADGVEPGPAQCAAHCEAMEHTAIMWIPLGSLVAWIDDQPDAVIGASVAVFALLGWV